MLHLETLQEQGHLLFLLVVVRKHSNNAAVSKAAITKAIIILGVGLAHWI